MKLTSLPSSTSLIANPLSDHHEILNFPLCKQIRPHGTARTPINAVAF